MTRRTNPFCTIRDESGWALMDAVWSAAIVVMAFIATQSVFGMTTRSAQREAKKSQAMLVAQQQIDWMRSKGQKDGLSSLEALNNTTTTVTYRGAPFRVTFSAVQQTSIAGGNKVEPCSIERSMAPDTEAATSSRPFMAIGVTVVDTSGPTGSSSSRASLQSSFAAEASADATLDAMLRVYILDPSGAAASGVTSVKLFNAANVEQPLKASNATFQCYLFTGLSAGDYTIKVGSTTLQNVYLGGSGSELTQSVKVPTGVLQSKTVTAAGLVNVTPSFAARTDTGTATEAITPANANGFVRVPDGAPYWQVQHQSIDQPPTTLPAKNYFYGGATGMYLPPQNSAMRNKLYPTPTPYDSFAGPCRINDPGEANRQRIPSSLPNPNWITDGTVNPSAFRLSLYRPSASLTAGSTSRPSPSQSVWSTVRYYWNQLWLSGQVQARLTGSNASGTNPTITPDGCHPSFTFNNWQRVGTTIANGGTLSNQLAALPTGRYDFCIRVRYSYKTQEYYQALLIGSGWQGSTQDVTTDAFVFLKDVIVGYNQPPAANAAAGANLTPADSKTQINLAAPRQAADCANSTLWS